jgi:hypothetical protein
MRRIVTIVCGGGGAFHRLPLLTTALRTQIAPKASTAFRLAFKAFLSRRASRRRVIEERGGPIRPRRRAPGCGKKGGGGFGSCEKRPLFIVRALRGGSRVGKAGGRERRVGECGKGQSRKQARGRCRRPGPVQAIQAGCEARARWGLARRHIATRPARPELLAEPRPAEPCPATPRLAPPADGQVEGWGAKAARCPSAPRAPPRRLSPRRTRLRAAGGAGGGGGRGPGPGGWRAVVEPSPARGDPARRRRRRRHGSSSRSSG